MENMGDDHVKVKDGVLDLRRQFVDDHRGERSLRRLTLLLTGGHAGQGLAAAGAAVSDLREDLLSVKFSLEGDRLGGNEEGGAEGNSFEHCFLFGF